MEKSKQAAFVKAMGKKRPKFAKGGMIRKLANRKYFDDGGTVTKQENLLAGPGGGSTVQNATNPNTGILGSIGGALGLNNNFVAQSANIQQGTNAGQLNDAYTGAQQGLTAQQGLANTLAPQAAGAVANQNAVANQQLGILNGTGPNPALAQLAQTTATNVGNQAALQAGQRGASGNVGLMARNIGQQGAATEQQAVGQGATMAAGQQIAAGQNLANLSNQQVGQAGNAVTGLNTAQQNEQNILQNANTSGNNAAVGMQSNINNTNAATAAGNQSMAGNILGSVGSAISSIFAKGGMVGDDTHHLALAEMNSASLAHTRKNFAGGGDVGWGGQYTQSQASSGPSLAAPVQFAAPTMKSLVDLPKKKKAPSDPAAQNPNDQYAGSGMTADQMGEERSRADAVSSGGLPAPDATDQTYGQANPQTQLSASNNSAGDPTNFNPDTIEFEARGGMMGQPMEGPHGHVMAFMSGGKVPAMVSPGEIYLSPEDVHKVVHEGANPLKMGKKIPGKPKVKGDSLKNDNVPATLEEGGVVLPRHITTAKKMSPEKAQLFVHRAVLKKARK